MKIAIVGSRTYTNKTKMKNFMFRLKMEHQGVEIVSGGAKDGQINMLKGMHLSSGYLIVSFHHNTTHIIFIALWKRIIMVNHMGWDTFTKEIKIW